MQQVSVFGVLAVLGLAACQGKSPVASSPAAAGAAKLNLEAYKLELSFNDGASKEVDLKLNSTAKCLIPCGR